MALVDRMVTLNARLQSIPIRLGVPQFRDLMVRHVELDQDLMGVRTDELLAPRPQVANVPTRLVGLGLAAGRSQLSSGDIVIAQDDFQVTGIPRSYSLDYLQKDVEFYVINPPIVEGSITYDSRDNPAGGIFCKLLTVRDNELLTWNLILRKMVDHYDLSTGTVDY